MRNDDSGKAALICAWGMIVQKTIHLVAENLGVTLIESTSLRGRPYNGLGLRVVMDLDGNHGHQ